MKLIRGHVFGLYIGLKVIVMDQWLIISVFAAAVAVYAMVDILMIRMSYKKKAIWFAIVVLIPIVGPILYLLKKKKLAEV